jgi:hypothetical protein
VLFTSGRSVTDVARQLSICSSVSRNLEAYEMGWFRKAKGNNCQSRTIHYVNASD